MYMGAWVKHVGHPLLQYCYIVHLIQTCFSSVVRYKMSFQYIRRFIIAILSLLIYIYILLLASKSFSKKCFTLVPKKIMKQKEKTY